MNNEEKLFSVQSSLNDQDFDDVFRIYLEMERGNEKKIAMITCVILCVICIVLMIIMRNITFLFYGIGCLVVGFAYLMVPVNRKFLAANRLMLGMQRETGFYPHAVTTMEIFGDEESEEMTEEEIEDATTVFLTGSVTAYENERGFLFADGKISNQFLYVPKRSLTEEEIEQISDFAQNRCSGGYHALQMNPMIAPEEAQEEKEENGDSLVSQVCDQYYGADKLHLHGEDGQNIDMDSEEEPEDEELQVDDMQPANEPETTEASDE